MQRTLQIAPNIANCTEHRKSHQFSSAILKQLISSFVANRKSQIAPNIANRTKHRRLHQVSSAILKQLISSSVANCKSHQTSQITSSLKCNPQPVNFQLWCKLRITPNVASRINSQAICNLQGSSANHPRMQFCSTKSKVQLSNVLLPTQLQWVLVHIRMHGHFCSTLSESPAVLYYHLIHSCTSRPSMSLWFITTSRPMLLQLPLQPPSGYRNFKSVTFESPSLWIRACIRDPQFSISIAIRCRRP